MKTMSYEEIIAEGIAGRLEFLSTQGIVEFCHDIDLDADTMVTVSGWVEYETEYLEGCNYLYNSYVFVNIDSVDVSGGHAKVDEARIATYLKKKLYD